MKPTATEDDHQIALLDTIHYLGARARVGATWISNEARPPADVKRGTWRYKAWLAKLKRKGYTPGACDLLVYWPGPEVAPDKLPFFGLFIECKKPGGRVSESQKIHHAELRADGIAHMVWDDGEPETAITWLRAHGCPL